MLNILPFILIISLICSFISMCVTLESISSRIITYFVNQGYSIQDANKEMRNIIRYKYKNYHNDIHYWEE